MDKDKKVKSAEIIQRNFRKYLQRREVKPKHVKGNEQGDNNEIKIINSENAIIQSLHNPQDSTTDISQKQSQQNRNLQRQNTIIIDTSAIQKENNRNNLNDIDAETIEELHKEINEISTKLNTFYKNLPDLTENLKRQDEILTNINQVLQNLENISTLEDCARIESEEITKEAILKHQQALNNLTFKWWQHLDEDN